MDSDRSWVGIEWWARPDEGWPGAVILVARLGDHYVQSIIDPWAQMQSTHPLPELLAWHAERMRERLRPSVPTGRVEYPTSPRRALR